MPVPFFRTTSNEGTLLLDVRSVEDYDSEQGVFVVATDNGNYHISASNFLFMVDNVVDIGAGGKRFRNAYVAGGVITSSDGRLKEQIADIPDAVLDAWEDVQWRQFKFKDAVREKGDAEARLHVGLVAQRILEVFEAHGLDACDYGLICHEESEASDALLDSEGNVIEPATTAREVWSLRYSECLAVEAACQRRKAERLEDRLSAAEARLDALEVSA